MRTRNGIYRLEEAACSSWHSCVLASCTLPLVTPGAGIKLRAVAVDLWPQVNLLGACTGFALDSRSVSVALPRSGLRPKVVAFAGDIVGSQA
jgi:hypothetical protein